MIRFRLLWYTVLIALPIREKNKPFLVEMRLKNLPTLKIMIY